MALGVWAAEVRKKNLLVIYLILTTIFGFAFLGIKYFEYKKSTSCTIFPARASMSRSSRTPPPTG